MYCYSVLVTIYQEFLSNLILICFYIVKRCMLYMVNYGICIKNTTSTGSTFGVCTRMYNVECQTRTHANMTYVYSFHKAMTVLNWSYPERYLV